MEMSTCLPICLNHLMLRQRRGTRSICSRERRMHRRLRRAAEDAILTVTLKALLVIVGLFFCYSNCKAEPLLSYFSSFPPLPKTSSKKISFSELFQQTSPNSHPLQELHCCCKATISTGLDGKYSCKAFAFWCTTQEQIHCVPTVSHALKRTFKNVWICLDQMKRKTTDEKENENSNNNKTQLFMKSSCLNTKIQTPGKVPYNRCSFSELITSDR